LENKANSKHVLSAVEWANLELYQGRKNRPESPLAVLYRQIAPTT